MKVEKLGRVQKHDDDFIQYVTILEVYNEGLARAEVKAFNAKEDSILAPLFAQVTSPHDCSGQWFSGYADFVEYNDTYNYAVVRIPYGCDV